MILSPEQLLTSSDPRVDTVGKSNIAELEEKDKEYTAIAKSEGKPYYKWDTMQMTMKIFENGIEDNGELPGLWDFISYWLAITLKFIENEELQTYMIKFYNGEINYKDKFMGEEIYKIMSLNNAPYVYALYRQYLEKTNQEEPSFVYKVRELYSGNIFAPKLPRKIPNSDGTKLIDATREEVAKYMGRYISPERKKELDEEWERILAKHREDKK